RGAAADAYHDLAQSVTLLDLLGERYQAALSQLALGRLIAHSGARSLAVRYLDQAAQVFTQLGADRDLADLRQARELLTHHGSGELITFPADADEAIVRRIVDAAALPDLLGRETAAALLEATGGEAAVVFVGLPDGNVRLVAAAGIGEDGARALARSASYGNLAGLDSAFVEGIGRDASGPRFG